MNNNRQVLEAPSKVDLAKDSQALKDSMINSKEDLKEAKVDSRTHLEIYLKSLRRCLVAVAKREVAADMNHNQREKILL